MPVTPESSSGVLAVAHHASRIRRGIVLGVLLLHGLVLWVVHTTTLAPALPAPPQRVVSLTLLPVPAQPVVKPPSLPPPVPEPARKPAPKTAAPTRPPPAVPVPTPAPATTAPAAIATAALPVAPAAPGPQGVLALPSNSTATQATTAAAGSGAGGVAGASARPAPPRLELPIAYAEYLHNPQPDYPATSFRLREEGTVLLYVLVGVDGSAKDVQVKTSSGFERLDRAALQAVKKWVFVPGKRGGVPEEMWYDLPMRFKR